MNGGALSLSTLVFVLIIPASAQVFWINEFHYDNTGSDVGEFVEVAAPESFADLATVQLTLYNGGDGAPYGSSHHLGTFVRGETSAGIILYSKFIPGIQNGAPDGLALSAGGEVLQFLSYEGIFTARSGPAVGLTSTPIGLTESESTPVGSSLGLLGPGRSPADFTWNLFPEASPGQFNSGQTVVPEPADFGLVTAAAIAIHAFWRHRRNRRRRGPPDDHSNLPSRPARPVSLRFTP